MAQMTMRQLVSVTRLPLVRSAATSPAVVFGPGSQLDKMYPKIGKREVVGYGINGDPIYFDKRAFPCPAIRYREDTADVAKLREKEKGDWKKLSVEDKKNLYRASFRLTFAEMDAPDGEWKAVVAGLFVMLTASLWLYYGFKKSVYPALPPTLNPEWQAKMMERMIAQGQGKIDGISSEWDYEKGTWKN